MDRILQVSCAPEPDAERIIGEGLSAFNHATVGYADRVPLHVLVSDPDSGKVVGGITGRTSLGLMFIDLVYLPVILRGRDIGARMMALAEEEAVGVAAGRVHFTLSASKHRSSISVSAGAYLAKSPAIHRAPVVSFSPKIFAEAVKPGSHTFRRVLPTLYCPELMDLLPLGKRRSNVVSECGREQPLTEGVNNELLSCNAEGKSRLRKGR